jgi:hypothetical protein
MVQLRLDRINRKKSAPTVVQVQLYLSVIRNQQQKNGYCPNMGRGLLYCQGTLN